MGRGDRVTAGEILKKRQLFRSEAELELDQRLLDIAEQIIGLIRIRATTVWFVPSDSDASISNQS